MASNTTAQGEAAMLKVDFIGAGKCDICEEQRADVAEFRAGFMVWARICDSCCSRILRGYSKERGGAAE